MEITTEEIENGPTLVTLTGVLDIAGAERIDLQLGVLANSRGNLLVDMEGVSFLASMGIRSLLTAARIVSRRGGRMVLLKPQPTVEKVLVSTGVEEFMPIRHDRAEALAAFATA